ncbi:MAG: META domain-containing protein [Pseudomonadota bacterium]|nr:META domain-containing protein [Pseudomonadota bacterium]
MFKLWATAVLGSTLTLAACSHLPMGMGSSSEADAPNNQTSLANTAWTLDSLAGQAVSIDTSRPNHPHIAFASDYRVSGATGCNRMMGQAKVDGTAISLGALATTRMACMEDQLEVPFVQALNKTTQYQVQNNQLLLKDSTGKVVATLQAATPPQP